jgi:hypothetical protein
MKKPQKTRTSDGEEVPVGQQGFENLQPSTIDQVNSAMEDRNTKINALLNKITSADTASENAKMGDFKPPDRAELNVKKDMDDNTEARKYIPPTMSFADASIARRGTSFGVNEPEAPKYSNYNKSYEPPSTLPGSRTVPYYAKMGLGSGPHDDKLMEKINYMIHLLEEQHNERTSHITEEFLLYTFFTVIIVLICCTPENIFHEIMTRQHYIHII